ncbi:MAG: hypothetical protein ACYCX2_12045, partial [Christensenellales bacterium]
SASPSAFCCRKIEELLRWRMSACTTYSRGDFVCLRKAVPPRRLAAIKARMLCQRFIRFVRRMFSIRLRAEFALPRIRAFLSRQLLKGKTRICFVRTSFGLCGV